MDHLVAPLTATLSKLTTHADEGIFTAPPRSKQRQRSKSLSQTNDTPNGLVKPLSSAFHSTGILSKGKVIRNLHITPETPIKHKKVLGSIWNNTQVVRNQYTPSKSNSYSVLKPPLHTKPTTPTIATSIKSNKLHRSPLKETPTKVFKRPHLNLDNSSPLGNLERLVPSSSFEDKLQPPLHVEKSPLMAAKVFFKRLVKERKSTYQIPLSLLLSTVRRVIDELFFQCLDNGDAGLRAILDTWSDMEGSSDYFETKFELMGRLGHGAFADAFHVKGGGFDSAIKKTRHPFVGFKDALEKLDEVKMLLLVKDHPFCLCIKEAWIQFGYVYIETELCDRGSLLEYLEDYCSETPLEEDQIWRIMADIVQGIAYIHSHDIVHLDIKPANIFISESGALKIGDFGLATRPPVTRDLEGDRTYLAPEFLNSSSVSFAADIFR